MAVMWNEKKVKDKRNQWEGAESADALHCSTFVMAGSAWMGIAFIGNSSNMLSSICLLFKFELPSPVLLDERYQQGECPVRARLLLAGEAKLYASESAHKQILKQPSSQPTLACPAGL
jgi:hypothetical protein